MGQRQNWTISQLQITFILSFNFATQCPFVLHAPVSRAISGVCPTSRTSTNHFLTAFCPAQTAAIFSLTRRRGSVISTIRLVRFPPSISLSSRRFFVLRLLDALGPFFFSQTVTTTEATGTLHTETLDGIPLAGETAARTLLAITSPFCRVPRPHISF